MFQTNFDLMHVYHFSLSEMDAMIPWERDSYITLLHLHQERQAKEAEKRRQRQNAF